MARQKDFIVIGSGVPGLTFALKVCKFGSVGIITKDKLGKSPRLNMPKAALPR
ncbi:MAG: hypothetical protein CM1200mP16_00020 [Nitrospina sp.]|nr:MAG: hypothetical protein CM1200mP16_00020 [Nitrospina sp.]